MKMAKPKWLLVPVLALAVGVGAMLGGAGQGGKPVYAVDNGAAVQKNTITVSGNGKIEAAPDVAYVSVAVEARAATAKDAQAKNATQFSGLTKLLYETYKIATKDVKTTGFSVQPEYEYNPKDGSSKVKDYVAVHAVQVTTRDLNGIGKLLDDLSAAGANRVDGVRFDTEKQEQYELQALDNAMANAKAKAAALAKAAGKQVTDVVTITQNSASSGPIFINKGEMAAADSAAGAPSTSVQTGEITVSADITVVYEMQ
ncbi:SIMPL domain-containing protein [Paenibacillus sp. MWE-103]|uniref:SIMPL domain-containing protein n=1 Tax=Paenibacillus artemisiicola TaxID=1172618 RepID=A0ABS3WIZ1_9BACL|nr:SIMPL domain-containing protein [Paenibacillus artemisiicola]MBO7748213.1 SIMPL domain-containing protein [Paenibacillus artemisiicola]